MWRADDNADMIPQALPDVDIEGVRGRRGPALERYAQFSFAHGGDVHAVYHLGERSAPPILILPELAGFAPGQMLFAERLVDKGFQVYLPWLLGPLGQRAYLSNALRLCVSREFGRLRAGVTAPVTLWLRALVTHISAHNGRGGVAAIGMCLTGAFVIPLLLHPEVTAAVAAQPAVPLSLSFLALGLGGESRRQALNVARADIEQARDRLASGAARLLAVRCAADRVCPADKLLRLQAEFPVGLTLRTYGAADSRNALGDRPHATYTKEFRLAAGAGAEHWSRQAFADLVQFLRGGLA
jgi:dienelactone hydrolase